MKKMDLPSLEEDMKMKRIYQIFNMNG